MSSDPLISIIVVVHNMPEQAWNTLQSLQTPYQRRSSQVLTDHSVDDAGASPAQNQQADALNYEVVVVENRSENTLSPERILALPSHFRYLLRDEQGVSPAAAVNAGLELARGDCIGLLIDGARLLSPGVLALVRDAGKAFPNALINVPGYYLSCEGAESDASDATALTAMEQSHLQSIQWQQNGYRLFERAVFSNGNRHGYLRPFMESTAFFVNRWALDRIGGADESFQLSGGGALILHMFRQLGMMAELDYVVLPGEGNFHQFHGGVSTRRNAERDELVKQFKRQLDSHWQGGYQALSREAIMLGKLPEQALGFLHSSCELAAERRQAFSRQGRAIWPDADALGLWHGE